MVHSSTPTSTTERVQTIWQSSAPRWRLFVGATGIVGNLDGDGIGPAGRRWMRRPTSGRQRRQPGWPKTPRALAGIIKRLAPNLRRMGIEVDTTGHIGRGAAKRKAISLLEKKG